MRAVGLYEPTEPVAKQRPKFRRLPNGGGQAYTPSRTVNHEKLLAAAWTSGGLPKLEGPLSASIAFVFARKKSHLLADGVTLSSVGRSASAWPQGDTDNFTKTVLDGLNGVAYDDDVQIVRLKAVKAWADPAAGLWPGTWLVLTPEVDLAPSVARVIATVERYARNLGAEA